MYHAKDDDELIRSDDAEFLRQNWQTMTDKQLAKKLGRDEGCIKARRHKFGMHRDKLPPIAFTVNSAAKVLSLDTHVIIRWLDMGWLKGKRHGKGAGVVIKPGDLREFLRNNPNAWNSDRAPRIVTEINLRELEKDMRKWRAQAGHVQREVPDDLRPAFARFVADVAMAASERIKEGRCPQWYREKLELDREKPENRARKWTRDDDKMLRKLYVQGLDYCRIAKEMGRSYADIAHRIGRTNIWEA